MGTQVSSDQGYFISGNAGLYIFSKMVTQPLQRMKSHQLEQNSLIHTRSLMLKKVIRELLKKIQAGITKMKHLKGY